MLKRIAREVREFIRKSLLGDKVNTHFAYYSLNVLFTKLRIREGSRIRDSYSWGLIQAAHLASNLGVEQISAIEFGVAAGNGLLAMERAAICLQEKLGVGIEVYGFDTGAGLPRPTDYRDLPNLWSEGAYAMDEALLRKQLTKAHLMIGLVEETLPAFIASQPAPVGFVSFDLDQYRSTKQALQLFEAAHELLLPRVHCYFDDILGFTYGDHNGERLAVKEFNVTNEGRLHLSPIYGLRHYLPREVSHSSWADKMYLAHILDHHLYNVLDGLVLQTGRKMQEKV